jgi:hypothetical protein
MSGGPERTTTERIEEFLRLHRESKAKSGEVEQPPVSECLSHMVTYVSGYDKQAPERDRPPLTTAIVRDEFNRFREEQIKRRNNIPDYTIGDIIEIGWEELNFKRADLAGDRPQGKVEAELMGFEEALRWLVRVEESEVKQATTE